MHTRPLTRTRNAGSRSLSPQVRGMRPLAFSDLWYYSVSANSWTLKVPPAGADGVTPLPGPPPRSHLSFVPLTDSTMLLYGGALCIPGCSCYGDTWLYDTTTNAWSLLNTTDAPIHRYRQNVVVHGSEGAIYLFGGESYQPYMYHNAVNRLALPQPLAEQMIQRAGGAGGGGGKGGGGSGKRGGKGGGGGFFGRARSARLQEGGRGAAELDEPSPSFLAAAASITSDASSTFSSTALASIGSGRHGSSNDAKAMFALPAIALIGGLAVWGARARQKRQRRGVYRSVESATDA